MTAVETLDQYLPQHPFFADLGPRAVERLSRCAVPVHRHAGEYLFQEGEPADRFYVIRRGRVSIESHTRTGRSAVLDTAQEGDVVGWSWLVPPYRWQFDARTTAETSALAFDAICVRAACEEDPAFGYALLERVTQVMLHRLRSARLRILDGADGV